VSPAANEAAIALLASLNEENQTIAASALATLKEGQAFAGPFARLVGVHFDEYGGGRCTASVEVREHLLNPHGIAHGGVAFSLADSACGGAALSAIGEPRVVTQDMQIRYHGPARPGTIAAEAKVIHHGTRTITTACEIRQGGLLIASVTATFAILSEVEVTALRRQPG
jgi:acyl-CoA thioesterase